MIGHMHVVAERVVMQQLCASQSKEYCIFVNNELYRHQAVYHPQIHVIAGRQMNCPPPPQ